MPNDLNEQTLTKALAELDAALTPSVSAAATRLAKNDDGAPPPPPHKEPDGDEGPGGAEPPGEDEAQEHQEGGGDDGFPATPEALDQMVSQLPDDKKQMLYLALKRALHAAPPGGDTPPPPPPDGSPIGKSEVAELKKLVKSQGEQLAKTQKDLTTLVDVLNKKVGAPLRKAVTSASFVPRTAEPPKPLTKAEVDARLKEKIGSGSLNKSQRNKILDFYNGGSRDLTLVEDLLKT